MLLQRTAALVHHLHYVSFDVSLKVFSLMSLSTYPLMSLPTQYRRNATRLCDHVVPDECLRRETPEACISQLTEAVLGAGPAAAAAAGGSSSRAAAIAAPVAVGGALLVAAAACALWVPDRQLCCACSPVGHIAVASAAAGLLHKRCLQTHMPLLVQHVHALPCCGAVVPRATTLCVRLLALLVLPLQVRCCWRPQLLSCCGAGAAASGSLRTCLCGRCTAARTMMT